ncbi:hypothetical protein [Nitrosomonas sp. Is37]|uniref:hypothetical protein n=1 Tax=Nitrosomonas sp. Is37 TaxID=3080535 RepID=UPI00294B39AE|nr:hypothetical protein [Nitrosomonas sp. Is37]MDV6343914.1 hypothetical protein [Nitrosomonas sp. Is37]
MAKKTCTPVNHQSEYDITSRDNFSLESCEAMIRNTAFYFEAKRACTLGFDLDCKLVAAVELKRSMRKS